MSSVLSCAMERRAKVLDWIRQHRDSISTPCYLYDELTLDHAIHAYRELLPPNAEVFYSLKANAQPALLRHLAAANVGFEVGTVGEWRLWAATPEPSPSLLVGGVCKGSAFLRKAVARNAQAVVVTSEAEWNRMRELWQEGCSVPALLRINVREVEPAGSSTALSPFGLSASQADSYASECPEFIAGLHFYCGSQRLHTQDILRSVKNAALLVLRWWRAGRQTKVVACGLGCGVPFSDRDSSLDYAVLGAGLKETWKALSSAVAHFWFEAGRILVAECGFFITRVLEKRHVRGSTVLFVDGGLQAMDGGFGAARVLRRSPALCCVSGRKPTNDELVTIMGRLCAPQDQLAAAVLLPALEERDLVVVPNAGAYCMMTAMWGFNSHEPFSEVILNRSGQCIALTAAPEYWHAYCAATRHETG